MISAMRLIIYNINIISSIVKIFSIKSLILSSLKSLNRIFFMICLDITLYELLVNFQGYKLQS